MKKILPLILALACCRGAWALEIELRNASDGQLFSGIEFKRLGRSGNLAAAKQYLKIAYPEVVNQELRLYTNNRSWEGAPGTGSGLVSVKTRKDSIPLYWISFSTPIADGTGSLPADVSLWRKISDLNDPDFSRNRSSAGIPLNGERVSILYFATQIPADAALGDYTTNLVIELVSPVPDIKAPELAGIQCSQVPFVEPVKFETVIADDFNVEAATFYFRSKGGSDFSQKPFTLTQDPGNPFQWKAAALFSKIELPIGQYEYYIEANDGFTRSFRGLAEAPLPFDVVDEFTEFSARVSGAAPLLASNPCALQAGSPDFVFPNGSVPQNTIITVKKIHPSLLLSFNGQSALSAFEFGPKGMQFARPVKLTFPYRDAGQDGIVDGTDQNEKDLKVFWFDGFDWRSVGGNVDVAANTVTTEILHFSIYALFFAGPGTEETVRPLEKIITPNGDGQNDFAQFNLGGEFELSIFDVHGERIRRIQNLNVWDGKKDDGSAVETGVYVYQLRSNQLSKTVSGTLGVAR